MSREGGITVRPEREHQSAGGGEEDFKRRKAYGVAVRQLEEPAENARSDGIADQNQGEDEAMQRGEEVDAEIAADDIGQQVDLAADAEPQQNRSDHRP